MAGCLRTAWLGAIPLLVLAALLLLPKSIGPSQLAALLGEIAVVSMLAVCLSFSSGRKGTTTPPDLAHPFAVALLVSLVTFSATACSIAFASLRVGSAELQVPRSTAANQFADLHPDFSSYGWFGYSPPPAQQGTLAGARKKAEEAGCCVLLVTASDEETNQARWAINRTSACLEVAASFISYETVLPGSQRVQVVRPVVYYVGQIGSVAVVLVQSDQGSIGPSASETIAARAIADWEPSAVVCLGAGFATNPSNLTPGDVMVSAKLYPYEHRKVFPDGRTQGRANVLAASSSLLGAFQLASAWTFAGPASLPTIDPHYGAVLTGEKLVNNLSLRETLLNYYPDSIGGEMEGAGVAAAAIAANVRWIVVKGVMDWADGTKNDSFKKLAASAAADFVSTVLANPAAVQLICP